MALARLITLLAITTLTNAADDTSVTPQQHDCGGLRGDGSCAATTTSVCRGVQNFASAAGRVRLRFQRVDEPGWVSTTLGRLWSLGDLWSARARGDQWLRCS